MFCSSVIMTCIVDLKLSKVAGADGIVAEHLKHCHPIVTIGWQCFKCSATMPSAPATLLSFKSTIHVIITDEQIC